MHLLTSSIALLFTPDRAFLLLTLPEGRTDGGLDAVLVFDPPRALTTVVRGLALVKTGGEVSAIVETTETFPWEAG